MTKSKFLDPFKDDFHVMVAAAKLDALLLAECTVKETGELCAAVCVTYEKDGATILIPVALMDTDLLEKLLPPKTEEPEAPDGSASG